MKKILLLIITFLLMLTPKVSALTYFESVTINTSFSEEIDMNSINEIYFCLEDGTQEEKIYTVKQSENFSTILTSIPAGTLRFDYGIVDNDRAGVYKITGTTNISTDYKTATVNILVENQNNVSNDHDLTDEVLDIIASKTTTTTQVSTTTVSDMEDVVIGAESTTTSTTITKETENDEVSAEKKKKEEESAKNRQKNNTIGIIIFSTIGVILLIGILYATVKISKANK